MPKLKTVTDDAKARVSRASAAIADLMSPSSARRQFKVAGLFAGIAGVELGLRIFPSADQ